MQLSRMTWFTYLGHPGHFLLELHGYPDLTKTINPSGLSDKQNNVGNKFSQMLGILVYARLSFSNHGVSELVKECQRKNSFELLGLDTR